MPLFGPPDIEKLRARHNIPGLVKALDRSDDTVTRQAAAQALGVLAEPDAERPLLEALHDRSPSVRAAAAVALKQTGTAHAIQPLITMLADPEPSVCKAAIVALGELGDAHALEALALTLDLRGDEVQSSIFVALGQIGARLDDADVRAQLQADLFDTLQHPDLELRRQAANALDTMGWHPGNDDVSARYWLARGEVARAVALGVVAVPPLLQAFPDSDAETCQMLAQALVQMGPPVVAPILNALDGQAQVARQAATWVLRQIGPAAVEPLLDALLTVATAGRVIGLQVLGQYADPRALPLLAQSLLDDETAVHEAAFVAITVFGQAAVPALLAALRSPHPGVCWHAAATLHELGWRPQPDEDGARYLIVRERWDYCARIGPAAIVPLAEALEHWDSAIRKNAAGALLHIGGPGYQALAQSLTSNSPHTRALAASALGQAGGHDALKPLLGALNDDNKDVSMAAMRALIQIKAPVDVLAKGLWHNDHLIRKAAAWALGRHGHERAVDPLVAALEDSDAEVRLVAVQALAKLADARSVRALDALRADPDEQVQRAVHAALEHIFAIFGSTDVTWYPA